MILRIFSINISSDFCCINGTYFTAPSYYINKTGRDFALHRSAFILIIFPFHNCCCHLFFTSCLFSVSVFFLYHISNPEKNLGCRCRQYLPDQHPVFYCSKLSSQSSKLFLEMRYFPPSNWIHRNSFFFKRL